MSFCCYISNKTFDIACKLTKSTVYIFTVEVIFDLGEDELSGLFLFQRLCISLFLLFLWG